MNHNLLIVYVVLAGATAWLMWHLAQKYGGMSLVIFSSPIHRLNVDVGFALKLLYVVIIGMIVRGLWRAKGDPFVLHSNSLLKLQMWLFGAISLSSLVNGAEVVSLRRLIVFGFLFAGAYLVQRQIRGSEDISRLVDIYLVTGFLLGLSGLLFYVLFFKFPSLYVEGSFFDAVTYNPDHPWSFPALQSIDVGSNAYALSILPFQFVAMGTTAAAGVTFRRRVFAGVIFVLLTLNLLLSFSRGGVLAFVVAAVLWVFALRGRRIMKGLLVMALFAMIPFAPRVADVYRSYSYMKGVYSGDDRNLLSGRDRLVRASLAVFKKHPLLGVGEGNISDEGNVGKEAHNMYLEALAEYGAVGFTICGMIVAATIRQLLRGWGALRGSKDYDMSLAFCFGLVALLIAMIPTSGIHVPLLWIQFAIIFAIGTVYQHEQEVALAV